MSGPRADVAARAYDAVVTIQGPGHPPPGVRIRGRAFFDLQIACARRVRELTGLSLDRALLDYTNLYVRFGLGRDFRSGNPRWREYVEGLRAAEDAGAFTERFYRRDAEARTAPPLKASFGCFSYALSDSGAVRLHFWNVEPGGRSPLARDRAGRRRAELTALCGHLARHVDPTAPVKGCSWLYNLEGYRRLFPPSYLASARAARNRFRSMPLWGQFLDREGRVREAGRDAFLSALARLGSPDGLQACFPLQALAMRAPARDFFVHFAA